MTPLVSAAACSYAMAVVILTALLLSVLALVVAGWKRFRLGSRLLALSCGDYSLAWAELATVEALNLENEQRMREAMNAAFASDNITKRSP